MSDLPVPARILLAWETGTEPLTSRAVMERARTTDVNEFNGLLELGCVERLPPYPRDEASYRITPKGWDRRDRYTSPPKH
jgi:hypothetical protein